MKNEKEDDGEYRGVELHVPSDPRYLRLIRQVTLNVAEATGFSRQEALDMRMAVDEACANVIRHAYLDRTDKKMAIRFLPAEREMEVIIEDSGRPADPATIQHRDLDDIRPGGLGVFFIRHLMEQVEYHPREGRGTRLRMVKRKGGMKLQIKERQEGKATIVNLKGEIDMYTSSQIKVSLNCFFDEGRKALLINMEEVNYIDSAGLAALIEVQQRAKEMGVQFELTGLKAGVKDTFATTRLEKFFKIYSDEKTALESFK